MFMRNCLNLPFSLSKYCAILCQIMLITLKTIHKYDYVHIECSHCLHENNHFHFSLGKNNCFCIEISDEIGIFFNRCRRNHSSKCFYIAGYSYELASVSITIPSILELKFYCITKQTSQLQ